MRVVGDLSWGGIRRVMGRWWRGVTEGPPARPVTPRRPAASQAQPADTLAGPGPVGTAGAWQATPPPSASSSAPRARPRLPYDILAPRRAGRPPIARTGASIRARIDAQARWLDHARAAVAEFYTGNPPAGGSAAPRAPQPEAPTGIPPAGGSAAPRAPQPEAPTGNPPVGGSAAPRAPQPEASAGSPPAGGPAAPSAPEPEAPAANPPAGPAGPAGPQPSPSSTSVARLPYDLGHGLEDQIRQAKRKLQPSARALRTRVGGLLRPRGRNVRSQATPTAAGAAPSQGRRLRAPSTSWAAALILAFAVGLWAGGAAFSQTSAASTATPTPASPGSGGTTTPAPVRIIRSVQTSAKAIALTFDDGPSPKYTPMVLQLLQQYGAHATFFVIGQEVERYPQILKAEVDGGNEIGNHGYHHLTLKNVSTDQLISEVQTAEQTLVSLTGSKPALYRLPGGKGDPAALRQLAGMGYKIVMWSVDTRDYVYRSPAAIVAQVQKEVTPGAIVIFHDGGGSQQHTVDALKTLLPWLKEQGYQMMTVSQLLEMPRATVTK